MLCNSTGCMVHTSTICRTVHRLGMTRQRIKHILLRQSEAKGAEFQAEISVFNTSMLLWIDETRFDGRSTIRKYGYGIRGQPPHDQTLVLRGKRYSAIGVLSTEGVQDVYLTDDSVDGDTFSPSQFVAHSDAI